MENNIITLCIGGKVSGKEVRKVIEEQYANLGAMKLDEFLMLISFSVLICLWFFQKPRFMDGWADKLESNDINGNLVKIGAATPAFVMVLIVFALPAVNPFDMSLNTNRPGIVTWEIVQNKLQWGVIILLGGGFALSKGVKESGKPILI